MTRSGPASRKIVSLLLLMGWGVVFIASVVSLIADSFDSDSGHLMVSLAVLGTSSRLPETTDAGTRNKPAVVGKIQQFPIRLPSPGDIDQAHKSVSGTLQPGLEMEVETFATTGRTYVSSAKRASFVNQEMDRKLATSDLSPDYADEMIATWRDRKNDELVRNFAVQHLERYARECVVRGTWDPDSSDAADIRAALEEAVLETGTSVGGAALLALARLSEIDPNVDRARLGARASSLVSDPSAPAANRASAAQVCGLLLVRSALPALRSLATDPATPTPLRLAASHAVETVAER